MPVAADGDAAVSWCTGGDEVQVSPQRTKSHLKKASTVKTNG
jgi:hypothetical protein